MDGKVKGHIRIARQAEAELKRVQAEQSECRVELDRAIQEKNDILK
jgi:hypothetical protein